MAFYFQVHYKMIINNGSIYHDISITHADGQRFTRFGNSFPHENLRSKQTSFKCGLTPRGYFDLVLYRGVWPHKWKTDPSTD